MLADLGDEPPTIKFGDASVAAPFTSKISSLTSGNLGFFFLKFHLFLLLNSPSSYTNCSSRQINACSHGANVQDSCAKLPDFGVLDECHVFGWNQARRLVKQK